MDDDENLRTSLQWLVNREQYELTKTETRVVTLPDGTEQGIKLFNVTWRWLDRIAASYLDYTEEKLIGMAFEGIKESKRSIENELELSIPYIVHINEEDGRDITADLDADAQLYCAKKAQEKWRKRYPKDGTQT